MKFAYPIGTPETKGPMLAYQGDTDKIIGDLKAIGYDGLELFMRNPKEINTASFTKSIEKSGLEIAAVGTAPAASEDKLTFTDKTLEIRKEAINRVKDIIDFASILDTQVNISRIRGNIHSDDVEKSWEWIRQAFVEICEYAEKKNVNLAIEPQNKTVSNHFNSTQETLKWIEDANLPNLFIMLDVYHMNLEDKSIFASLIEAGKRNIHVHFADSNRGIIGSGHINFIEIMRVLEALKYKGYISVEIAQKPDSLTAARKSWEYLNFIMRNL